MKSSLRAVGLAGLLLTWAAAAAGQPTDHLACYKIKDSQAKATYTATVDGLVVQAGCKIQVPAVMACVPASKTNVSPPAPGGGGIGRPNSFVCYKMKCPKVAFPSLMADDQFGTRLLTPKMVQGLVCAPSAGPTGGGFPATGQASCHDVNGAGIPCAGSGQDGEFQAGAPLSYTDNGDGTVTDNNTGLTWEKKDNSGFGNLHHYADVYSWNDTFGSFLARLNNRCRNNETVDCSGSGDVGCTTGADDRCGFAAHRDWRLPNVKELESLVDFEFGAFPAVKPAFNNNCAADAPVCTVLQCSCTQASSYWSSSVREQSPFQAWTLNFNDGRVQSLDKTGPPRYVRAVRGGL